MAEQDKIYEDIKKITEPKWHKLKVPTFEEYISHPEIKYHLELDNLIKLLIKKNIISDDELIEGMKKDFNDILPDLKVMVETHNKYCGE